MKAKIVRTDAELEIIEQHLGTLSPFADVVTVETPDVAALALAAADADVILTCYDPVPAQVIEGAAKLLGIVKYGVGTDNIDIDAASKQGVMVVNCPDYGSDTIADHAFALLIALARRIPELDRAMRAEPWPWPRPDLLGHDLARKTIGIIGIGRIGRCMARRAGGFGMTRLVSDPYVAPADVADLGVTFVALDELLARSDFVSIHCVLTPETRGLIGARELSAMKPTAYLIDVSRGAIVDEAALVQALDAGAIAGAAFDVFPEEPLGADFPLRGRDNVILTPHLAWYTHEAFQRVERDTLEAVLDVLEGRRPRHLKNTEVWK